MDRLKKKARTALQAVVKLHEKVRNLSHNQGEVLDKNMEIDLITIMHDNAEKINSTYAEGTFARLFGMNNSKLHLFTINDKLGGILSLKLISSSA